MFWFHITRMKTGGGLSEKGLALDCYLTKEFLNIVLTAQKFWGCLRFPQSLTRSPRWKPLCRSGYSRHRVSSPWTCPPQGLLVGLLRLPLEGWSDTCLSSWLSSLPPWNAQARHRLIVLCIYFNYFSFGATPGKAPGLLRSLPSGVTYSGHIGCWASDPCEAHALLHCVWSA